MERKANIKYSAVIVGVKKETGNIMVPECMAGVVRGEGNCQIALHTASLLLKEYAFKASKRIDHIDVHYTVTTDDGWVLSHKIPEGFKAIQPLKPNQGALMELMIAPKTAEPTSETSRGKEQVTVANPNNGKKDYLSQKLKNSQDDIPDEKLTRKQRERRQQEEQEAEDRAFSSYKRKQGK
jgi:hypothetical protein